MHKHVYLVCFLCLETQKWAAVLQLTPRAEQNSSFYEVCSRTFWNSPTRSSVLVPPLHRSRSHLNMFDVYWSKSAPEGQKHRRARESAIQTRPAELNLHVLSSVCKQPLSLPGPRGCPWGARCLQTVQRIPTLFPPSPFMAIIRQLASARMLQNSWRDGLHQPRVPSPNVRGPTLLGGAGSGEQRRREIRGTPTVQYQT